jgi:hypothetical protein
MPWHPTGSKEEQWQPPMAAGVRRPCHRLLYHAPTGLFAATPLFYHFIFVINNILLICIYVFNNKRQSRWEKIISEFLVQYCYYNDICSFNFFVFII